MSLIRVFKTPSVDGSVDLEIVYNPYNQIWGISITDESGETSMIALDGDAVYEMAITIKETMEADE